MAVPEATGQYCLLWGPRASAGWQRCPADPHPAEATASSYTTWVVLNTLEAPPPLECAREGSSNSSQGESQRKKGYDPVLPDGDLHLLWSGAHRWHTNAYCNSAISVVIEGQKKF